tara:strand:+ start:5557 stop:5952 length:396 start_codon:yes stop_codon:yes gene_type:complete
MNKILFLLIFVFVSTNVMAEWTAIKWSHEDGGLTLYVDYTTIRKDGDKVRMLSLVDFEVVDKKEIDLFSSRAQNEYDCKTKKIRQLFYALYSGSMGKGKMEHSNSEYLKWLPIKDGSMEEAMWVVACGKKT